MIVYPRGIGTAKNNALSVFLGLVEAQKLPPKGKVYAKYKFKIRCDPKFISVSEFTGNFTLIILEIILKIIQIKHRK